MTDTPHGPAPPVVQDRGVLRVPLDECARQASASPGPVVVELDNADWTRRHHVPEGLAIGHAAHPLPAEAASVLDRLTCSIAPAGPGRSWAAGTQEDLEAVVAAMEDHPQAVTMLDQVLRANESVDPACGVVVESLAYSLLLGGSDFAAWRAATPQRPTHIPADPIHIERNDDVLHVRLNVRERRNAFSRFLRDALIDALEVASVDPTIAAVALAGSGPCFSAGGDLDEFGTAKDLVAAHAIRVSRNAGLAVHSLRDRIRVTVHGACIGAGIEVPAFAGFVEARDGAYFRLPEIAMGLIPGAGGTVSIQRRIGRWRTAYMALSGRDVTVETALDWGLVDARA